MQSWTLVKLFLHSLCSTSGRDSDEGEQAQARTHENGLELASLLTVSDPDDRSVLQEVLTPSSLSKNIPGIGVQGAPGESGKGEQPQAKDLNQQQH